MRGTIQRQKVKGGFTVDIGRSPSAPVPLVDVRQCATPPYRNRELEFRVISSTAAQQRVVVAPYAGRSRSWPPSASALENLPKEGTVVKGVVKNLTDYGAFVDLPLVAS